MTDGAGSASSTKRAKSAAVGQLCWNMVGGIACCGKFYGPPQCLQAMAANGPRGQTARNQQIQMEHAAARFYLYANPVVASFGATLHKQVVSMSRSIHPRSAIQQFCPL
jgi:hypothetical protein